MTEQNLNMDIDSILDGTLDDLPDVPEFGAFPVGTHRGLIKKWEIKQLDDKKDKNKKNTVVVMTIEAQETVETPAGSDAVVSPGQTDNLSFFLVHHSSDKAMEIGQGKFKEIMASLASHFGTKSNRELMADSTGAECLFVTKQRSDKTDKDRKYTELVELKVL